MRPAYALLLVTIGCSPAAAKVETESGIYAAQLIACVENASTKQESRDCREAVTEVYYATHNLPRTTKDAGHE
jgi:hypothetical protein